MWRTGSLIFALAIGLLLALISCGLAEFATGPRHGHRVNTAALPVEAKAILEEHPGVPISAEQWRRLDKVMTRHSGWPGGSHLLATSVARSWYWFILLPIVAVGVLRFRGGVVRPAAALLVAAPSMLFLVYGFASSQHAALL